MKGLGVTKIVGGISCEGVLDELGRGMVSGGDRSGVFGTGCGFRVGWRTVSWGGGGVSCYFLGRFCSCWLGLHFGGGGGWALGYHSMGFRHFPTTS